MVGGELLPWQADAAAQALARRASWPHALLVTGQRGIGKRGLALHFARALLCEAPRVGGAPCGTCASCTYAAAGHHPDLRVVEPHDVDEEGERKPLDVIPIKHVHGLIEWAHITSHRGVAKVAVIVPAEAMNASAANALLKTLEEPPPATYLMLVAHQAGRVPPTLRSRCLRLAAPKPSAEGAQRWLAEQGVAEAATVLAQADGAPLLALGLADAAWQEERAVWLGALAKPKALPALALAARVEAGAKDERKDRLTLAIDWLAAWTIDLARVAAGGEPRRNPDFAEALRALASAVAPVALFRYHRLLIEQRALVAHPLQPRLVAETLLLGYRDLFR